MLAPFEREFLQKRLLGGKGQLPITPLVPAAGSLLGSLAASSAATVSSALPASHPITRALARVAQDEELNASACKLYAAWLGFMKGHLSLCGWDAATLVFHANAYAKHIGLPTTPAIPRKTIGMMGLKGVPGLVIGEDTPRQGQGQGQGQGPRRPANAGAQQRRAR